jgi:uncharacterized protein YcbK (DUF882 family)
MSEMSSLLALPDAPDVLLPGRRRFMQSLAGTAAAVLTPRFAMANDFWSRPRELWLYRPSTGEQVRAVYWADGQLVLNGYVQICQLLRDVQAGSVVQFDLVTLDIARGIYGWLLGNGIDRPIIINSGYRTARTNATEGGVRNSFHTRAQALDLRIEGVSPEQVGRFGLYLAGGGVGFYPGKNFTHLDRGRVRAWVG